MTYSTHDRESSYTKIVLTPFPGTALADAKAMRRSMELMAEEVLPRVNRALRE